MSFVISWDNGKYMYQLVLLPFGQGWNLTKIKMFLEDKFGIDGLYGNANWIRGSVDSRWTFPEEEFEELTAQLEDDPTLFIEVVSFEPGLGYLEPHTFQAGEWHVMS